VWAADTRRPRHLRGSGEVVGRPRGHRVALGGVDVIRTRPARMACDVAVGPWAFPMAFSPAYAVLE